MTRRFGLLLILALWLGGTGCAGTGRRPDGTSIFTAKAWKEAPAPPQKLVAATAETTPKAIEPAEKPSSLAKYFPGLTRNPADPPRLAGKYRPTWFGLRPNTKGTQVYTTDARIGLNQKLGPEPTTLPVALNVPAERSPADQAVTPANATASRSNNPSSKVSDLGVVASSSENSQPTPTTRDFGGTPSRPGEDEVNPLPPAAEPDRTTALADRSPETPAADPVQQVKLEDPEPAATVAEPRTEVVSAPVADEKPSPPVNPPSNPNQPLGLPEPTFPASYTVQATPSAATPAPAATPARTPIQVLAPGSPPIQVPIPPPTPANSTLAKSSNRWSLSGWLASSQAAPGPQAKASPQSDVCPACGHREWKRPCLRRFVRKTFNLGEFASPPTAEPH